MLAGTTTRMRSPSNKRRLHMVKTCQRPLTRRRRINRCRRALQSVQSLRTRSCVSPFKVITPQFFNRRKLYARFRKRGEFEGRLYTVPFKSCDLQSCFSFHSSSLTLKALRLNLLQSFSLTSCIHLNVIVCFAGTSYDAQSFIVCLSTILIFIIKPRW